MLKNRKDPGVPLDAPGTLRIKHCPSRLELELMGAGAAERVLERRGRRESREVRDPWILPAGGVEVD